MFMTTDVPFKGLNSMSDLPSGTYRGVCSFAIAEGVEISAAFVEYTLDGEYSPRVVDLVLTDQNGESYFRDFVQMRDRSWRDSYGERDPDLQMLLPPEISTFQILERRDIGVFVVGGEHVR